MDFNTLVMITNGIILNNTTNKVNKFSIDTRSLNKGDTFIPIKGNNTSGEIYLKEAVLKGANIVFTTSNDIKELININKNIGIIKIDDGLETLKKLSSFYRNKYEGIIIGITGSCGKTTTKEMLYDSLSSKYNVFKSYKNYNNIIGVCLNILSLKDEQIAIFELGMNHKNEISEMVKILKPEIGIITNIKEAHIGNLNSLENIYEAKKEIINDKMKVLFLNINDDYLKKTIFKNIIWFNNKDYDFKAYDDYIYSPSLLLSINAYGSYNIDNIVSVIEVSKYLNLSIEEIKNGLEKYKSFRIKKLYIKDALIIDDTYNANIASMKASIDYIDNLNYKYKILVLGDMLELGEYSSFYHKELGFFIRDKHIDKVYTYKNDSKYIGYTCQKISYHYTSKVDLINDLKEELNKDTVILFKGSRLLKMEEIIEGLND